VNERTPDGGAWSRNRSVVSLDSIDMSMLSGILDATSLRPSRHSITKGAVGVMTGLRLPDRCLSLFVSDQPVVVDRPVDGPATVS
jgi:hypothetical protein